MSQQTTAAPRRDAKEEKSESNPWPGPLILAGGSYQDGSVLANRLGLQFARVATVSRAWRARKRPVDADLREYVEAFERDGVLVIEDFLPAEVFAAVKAECDAAYAAGLFKSGTFEDNAVVEETLSLKKHKTDALAATWRALDENELLRRLAAAVIRRPTVEKLKIDVNYMSKQSDAPPPSRMVGTNYLHADVHYSSAKAWLYLNDIDEQNGAFVYARGSQKMTRARLAYEYDASIRMAKAKRDQTIYTTVPGGMVRIPTPKQLKAMGIVEEVISGSANTLVLADVMGFHRRGEFEEGRRREQIQIKFDDRPPRRPARPAGALFGKRP